jgi:hypothetical protein
MEEVLGKELIEYQKIWQQVMPDKWNFNLYYDNKKCNTDKGILGYFKITKPHNIYIACYKHVKKAMIPTIVHEYTHMKQFKRYGLIGYSFLALFRWKTLEPEARYNEIKIAKLLNVTTGY